MYVSILLDSKNTSNDGICFYFGLSYYINPNELA